MCGVMEYEGFTETWPRRDRIERLCNECGYAIPAGAKHVVSIFVDMGDSLDRPEEIEELPDTKIIHEHRECNRLASDAAEIVCNADIIPIGELEEHVAIAEAALAGVDVVDEYGEEYEHLDHERLPSLIARWDAIEATYGGERDLGGEG